MNIHVEGEITLTIEKETMRRMRGFTELASGEVAGMARVTQIGSPPQMYISDLRLFKNQKVSGASVDLENIDFMQLLAELPEPQQFKFLWHSHGTMDAFFSAIDQSCIEGFIKTSPFFISCVTAKRGGIKVRLDTIINGQWCTYPGKDKDDYKDLKKELNEHIVKEKHDWSGGFNWFDGEHMFYFGKNGRGGDLTKTTILDDVRERRERLMEMGQGGGSYIVSTNRREPKILHINGRLFPEDDEEEQENMEY